MNEAERVIGDVYLDRVYKVTRRLRGINDAGQNLGFFLLPGVKEHPFYQTRARTFSKTKGA